MDESNGYNHVPSSSAALASMMPEGTARTGSDRLRPLAKRGWQAASHGLTRDLLVDLRLAKACAEVASMLECVIPGLSRTYR